MARLEAGRADGIDAVAIVTPNYLYAPVATAFLEAGIHIICDKPLAITQQKATTPHQRQPQRGTQRQRRQDTTCHRQRQEEDEERQADDQPRKRTRNCTATRRRRFLRWRRGRQCRISPWACRPWRTAWPDRASCRWSWPATGRIRAGSTYRVAGTGAAATCRAIYAAWSGMALTVPLMASRTRAKCTLSCFKSIRSTNGS